MIDLDRREPHAGCPSNLRLDRLLAGELAAEPERELRAHLAACARCAARFAAIEEEARAFPREVWIQGEAAKARRALRAGRGHWGTIAASLSAAAAAVALFHLAPLPHPHPAGVRSKGGEALDLVVRHRDGSVEETSGDGRLLPGDAVRFRLSLATGGTVAVLGLDAAGLVTAYVEPVAVPAGRTVIEGSVVLDETPGAERFVAVICAAAPSAETLVARGRAALEAAAGDPRRVGDLGIKGCRQVSAVVEKEAP